MIQYNSLLLGVEKLYVRRIGMSDSGKRMSKLGQQFESIRKKGKTEVTRSLSAEQAEFIKEELHYVVIPTEYEITTQRIKRASEAMWFLQEIHRASKNGQKKIHKKIRKKELKVLERAGIQFRPVRYRIILGAN